MKTLGLKIDLQSPVLLAAAPPASNLTETLPFIPGNTVRGMLAHRYLQQGGKPQDTVFQSLFMTGQVRFGFARIHSAQSLPLSARSCKYDSGFVKDSGGHGVLDLLLSDYDKEERCPYTRDGEACNQAIDYFQGFWDPNNCCHVSVKTRLITRTAIDPIRGSARTGQLYLQRVLEEGQIFEANIELPDELSLHLAALLDQPFTARIGTGTSRGQGWVKVSQGDAEMPNWGGAAERFEEFQQKFRKVKRGPNEKGYPALAVTLLTDGLFHDDYLRDTTAPGLPDLAPLGIVPDEWNPEISTAFMDTRLIFGFDGEPLRLPRQPRLAVAAGSVFLFTAKEDCPNPTIPSGNGIGWIGDGNSEGYGQAVLWHPFHMVSDQKENPHEQ